ncbi:hypothetical protein ABZ467_36565 [Streptomyces sp. NPDC005727]|uniref:hypothetical protein n=1 Tax=Streptomyces sp. NPDC005727 TaxID=3157053 RepID=UPI0033D810E2
MKNGNALLSRCAWGAALTITVHTVAQEVAAALLKKPVAGTQAYQLPEQVTAIRLLWGECSRRRSAGVPR